MSDTFAVELCCIGFNPETSVFEAIIEVQHGKPLGGGCSQGTAVRVGFWIDIGGSLSLYLGESTIRVFEPPKLLGLHYPVNYAVHLRPGSDVLDPSTIQLCASADVLLTCVIAFGGVPLADSDKENPQYQRMTAWLQWPRINHYGTDTYSERMPWQSQVHAVHAIILKNKKILVFSGSAHDLPHEFALDPNFKMPKSSFFEELSNPFWYLPKPQLIPLDPFQVHKEYYKITTCALFDPDTHTFQVILPPEFDGKLYDIFCVGQNTLGDGRVLLYGGTVHWGADGFHADHAEGGGALHFSGLKDAALFDPTTNEWTKVHGSEIDPVTNERVATEGMQHGRYYPGGVVMANGNVFLMGGHPEATVNFHTNVDPEIYNAAQERVELLEGLSNVSSEHYHFQYFPGRHVYELEKPLGKMTYVLEEYAPENEPGNFDRLHLLPDGRIFNTSFSRQDAGFRSTEMPDTFIWDSVDHWKGGKIDTSIFHTELGVSDVGKRHPQLWSLIPWSSHYQSVLLPLRYSSQYDPTIFFYKSAKAFECSPVSEPVWRVLPASPLQKERANGLGIILVDGTVALIGGIDGSFENYPDSKGVLPIEIYDPVTKEWSMAAQITQVRNYHSVAVLLYDGSVLIAGSNRNADGGDLSARVYSFEIFRPDYLMRGPRPEFTCYPLTLKPGDTLKVALSPRWKFEDIREAVLIRCYGATHADTFDQRFVEVPMTNLGSTSDFEISLPANSALLPPGYYYLFMVSATGCPSYAQIISIVQ